MAQQLTIKQIAQKAGVSVGTVDRILHNRGNVSAEAMKAVQAVLKTCNYRRNIHTSAVAFKKTGKSLKLVATIPFSQKGEYWDLVYDGINKGLHEYGDISINCKFAFFDQFDSFSCKKVFDGILEDSCSAVIIAPTFVSETKDFCKQLDDRGIPYVFVDGKIADCNPVATYMADQTACGRLMARMTEAFTPADGEVAIFLPKRTGTLMSNNSLVRTEAFREYYSVVNPSRTIREGYYTTDDPQANIQEIRDFLSAFPDVKSIAVMISTGYLISDALVRLGVRDICVGGYDVTHGNERCIKEDTLTFIINQHPQKQGFNCIESVLHFLLYGSPDTNLPQMQHIDVILKENIL